MGEIIKYDFRKKKSEENTEKIPKELPVETEEGTMIDNDDNTIRFDFGKKKDEGNILKNRNLKEEKNRTRDPYERREIFSGLLIHREKLRKISQLPFSSSTALEMRNVVRGYTDRDLLDLLDSATDLDISKRPSFYHAISSELKDRMAK